MKHFYSYLRWSLIPLSFAFTGCTDEESETELPSDLFSISVEKEFLASLSGSEKERWVYMTDHDGKTIGEPLMLEDGLEYTWERTEGYNLESASFNIVYITHHNEPARQVYSLHTYADIIGQKAKFTPTIHNSSEPDPDEWHRAEIKLPADLPPHYLHQIRSPYSVSYKRYDDKTNGELIHHHSWKQNNNRIILLYSSSVDGNNFDFSTTPMYHWLAPEPNSIITLQSSDYQSAEDFQIEIKEGNFLAGSSYLISRGQLASGEKFYLNEIYFDIEHSQKKFNAFRVPEIFPDSWLYVALVRKYRGHFGSYQNQNIPSTISMNDERNLSLTGNLKEGVTISSNGSFTEAIIRWNYTNETSSPTDPQTSMTRYLRIADKQNNRTFKAEIPQLLLDRFPALNQELTYKSTYLDQYLEIDTFEDLFKIYFNLAPKEEKLDEYEATYIFPNTEQGNERQADQSHILDLPEENLYPKNITD